MGQGACPRVPSGTKGQAPCPGIWEVLEMELTVLGAYGPYPSAGKACSGYLLQKDGFNLLMECGNGVLSRLQYHIDLTELDAVLVSHLHADHISDIFIMRYALQISRESKPNLKKLNIYLPGEPVEERARFVENDFMDYHNIPMADKELKVGPFSVSFLETIHPIPCYAMKIESDGKKLVYSADTEYFAALESFASNATLFICEANYQNKEIARSLPNHLSAAQAAGIALNANTEKMIMTHLSPRHDTDVSLKEAREVFGESYIAIEGETWSL